MFNNKKIRLIFKNRVALNYQDILGKRDAPGSVLVNDMLAPPLRSEHFFFIKLLRIIEKVYIFFYILTFSKKVMGSSNKKKNGKFRRRIVFCFRRVSENFGLGLVKLLRT